jgi:hypothetical protein
MIPYVGGEHIKLGRDTDEASPDIRQDGSAFVRSFGLPRKGFVFVRERLAFCSSQHFVLPRPTPLKGREETRHGRTGS